MILRGHRSVVNQIRYSSRLHTIVSSGVEKIIKVRICSFILNYSIIEYDYKESRYIIKFSLDVDTISNSKSS